jgi:hypothetical protein
LGEQLIERAVITTVQRTQQRKLHWWSSGWHGYQNILVRAYHQRKLTGKRGRPVWEVPATVTLIQTVKHRDDRGRLLSLEIRAALGAEVEPAGTVHVERLNGSLRDRLNASPAKRTPSPNAMLPGMRWSGCSTSTTTSSGLIGPCDCLLETECVAITSNLQPWLWG